VAVLVAAVACDLARASAAGADQRILEKSEEDKRAGDEAGQAVEDARPVLKKEYVIEIKDHKFHPAKLIVPAGKKIKLRIVNLDKSPEEFESYDLNREKVVAGGGKITVYVGPLKPGTYSYFGEFNPDTAQGVIIAK